MAKKGQRINIKLVCTEPGGKKHAYYTTKNRVNVKDKLERKRFNPYLGRHAVYEEKKLK
ncbi:50S ribosomal protein L33 [Candidatus Dojkabacteria bacterium]|uniref:Large ribosomal subunit protein bL33 n=1 Tax=Candidatus Dojkabacteria bacterium TaxID=2099670 RepID=A0A955L8A4_9BACT|nr:50S ribosomal protein L33 [Candidatus Dojkabacteria bacterium]